MKKIIISLLACLMLLCSFSACNDGGGSQSKPKLYNVTVETSSDYDITVDKTSAEAFDEINVNVKLKTADKKLVAIKYGQTTVTQNSDGNFSFLMPTSDVKISAVLEDYVESVKSDTSSSPFVSFSSANPKTIVPDTGTVKLYLGINANWMTILNTTFTSSDTTVIPKNAIEIENVLSSSSNAITGAYVCVDTTKIQKGYSWLDFNFVNGNSSSQKGKITVKISVEESIDVQTWKEKLIFDTSKIDAKYQDKNFTVYLNDYDYIKGMNTQEYTSYSDLKIEGGKIVLEIEYAVGHKYAIGLYIPGETPADNVWFTLLENVGQGSLSTGYNQYKNSRLSFIFEDVTLTIGVTNP